MNSTKEQALAALLTSPTIREAAAKVGVSERTINGYIREDAEFRKAYDEHRQAIIRDASEKLTGAFTAAVDTLCNVMTNEDNNAATRVTAAKAIIEHGMKLFEVTDILQQLQDIKDSIEARK